MQSMSDDPRQILAEAGVECAEVDDWPLAIATIKAHTGYPNLAEAMNSAFLALARLVAKYKTTADSVIPPGMYCYSRTEPLPNGVGRRLLDLCPYWSKRDDKPEQENGYCAYLGTGDWEGKVDLLWDQCKECGVNDDMDDDHA